MNFARKLGVWLGLWGEWAARHRWLAGLIAVILVVAPVPFLSRLTFNNTPEAFFLKSDKTVEEYQDFRKKFANDEFTLVTLRVDPGREAQTLASVRELVNQLIALPSVTKVTAITNVRFVEGTAEAIDVGDYIPETLSEADQVARLRQGKSHPYFGGLYVANDGRHLGIVIETDRSAASVSDKAKLTSAVRTLIGSPRYRAMDTRAIGAPIIDADTYSVVSSETGIFGASVFLLVALGFLIAFRSWLGLLLPLLVAVLSVIFAFGFMGLIGGEVGMLTPMIPSFLVSVGIGSAIFLIDEYLQERDGGADAHHAMISALKVSGGPAVLAVVTTSAALLTFSASRVKPVQEVGVVMGVGLLAALVFTLLLFPLLAPLTKRRWPATNVVQPDRIRRYLLRIFDFVSRAPTAIVVAFAALLLVGLAGVVQLKVDYYYLGTFKESTRLRQDYAAANAAIPASNSIEVIVTGKTADFFKEPRALVALDKLAAWAERNGKDDVKPYSVADVVKELNQAYLGKGATGYAIPETRNAVSQLLLLFESSGNDELQSLLTPDLASARLTLLVPTKPYSAYADLVRGIGPEAERLFAAEGLGPVQVKITGVVPLWMKISDYLLENQIKSFAISAVVVAIVMILITGSLSLGLMMTATNALVVAIALGAMGWLGIFLDPFTILVGAIALGILDDDTIHFVRSVLDRIASGLPVEDAIKATYLSAGHAMLVMTAVLVASFSVYVFSNVASLTAFGLVVSGTIILGLVTEYLLTPAALLLMHRHLKLAAFRARPA
jgi:uncharacterized protein